MGRIIEEASDAFSTPLGTPYTSVLEKSESGRFGCEQLVQLYMEQLLISLIRGNRRTVEIKKADSGTLLLRICDYLEDNVEKKLTFDDIQKEFNTSASVIKRLFQNNMSCGIMEHFTRLKIDEAKRLIRKRKNFSEIADLLCFDSISTFAFVFKKHVGMTPSEYRNSIK
jgi:AraC-like DNA-binding protein